MIDQFTGNKTLGEWVVEKDVLEGIELPEFAGYKPTQQVEGLKVTPDSEDSELGIRYEKADTPGNGGQQHQILQMQVRPIKMVQKMITWKILHKQAQIMVKILPIV